MAGNPPPYQIWQDFYLIIVGGLHEDNELGPGLLTEVLEVLMDMLEEPVILTSELYFGRRKLVEELAIVDNSLEHILRERSQSPQRSSGHHRPSL